MKACGVVCILLGAVYSTYVSVRERRRKRALLSDLCGALSRLGDEVRLSRIPFPELLERLSETCGADAAMFFRTVSGGVRQGRTPSVVWIQEADALPLSAVDRATLREFASVLRGDEEQIRRAVSVISARLGRSLQEMDASAAGDIRRSAALIFSAAALIVILLY